MGGFGSDQTYSGCGIKLGQAKTSCAVRAEESCTSPFTVCLEVPVLPTSNSL